MRPNGPFYFLFHLRLSFSMVDVANSSWPCVNEHGFFRHGLLDRVEEAPMAFFVEGETASAEGFADPLTTADQEGDVVHSELSVREL